MSIALQPVLLACVNCGALAELFEVLSLLYDCWWQCLNIFFGTLGGCGIRVLMGMLRVLTCSIVHLFLPRSCLSRLYGMQHVS